MMRKKKLDPILAKTAELLDYPPEVIGDVVQHGFKFMKEFIGNPTHAGLRYHHFGVIRAFEKPLRHYLQRLVADMRRKPDDEALKEKFRKYWKLRELVKQDEQRRDYKKRFGS